LAWDTDGGLLLTVFQGFFPGGFLPFDRSPLPECKGGDVEIPPSGIQSRKCFPPPLSRTFPQSLPLLTYEVLFFCCARPCRKPLSVLPLRKDTSSSGFFLLLRFRDKGADLAAKSFFGKRVHSLKSFSYSLPFSLYTLATGQVSSLSTSVEYPPPPPPGRLWNFFF